MKKAKLILSSLLSLMCFWLSFQPVHANEIEYVSSTLWGGARDVHVVGDYSYCVFGNGMVILNVSDPENITFVSRLYFQGRALGISVLGNYAYLADGDLGLLIIDISNPYSPFHLGSYDTPGTAFDVFVKDSLVYVVDLDEGLWIISVSDPSNPQLVGNFDTPGYAYGVFVQDSLAFVADGDSGLHIISVSNPSNPQLLGSYDTPGNAMCAFVRDSVAYIADGDSGLQIISVYTPTNPYHIATYDTLDNYSRDVFVQDTIAYVADNWGLLLLSVSNPDNPYKVGRCGTGYWGMNLFVADTITYVAVPRFWCQGIGGLMAIDTRDAGSPHILGSYSESDAVKDIWVENDLVYVADWWGGLKILSNPYSPNLVGEYSRCFYTSDVVVKDTLAFLAGWWRDKGLLILNVKESTTPVEVGSLSTERGFYEIFVLDTLAFVAVVNPDNEVNLQIINVGDPSNPESLAYYETEGTPNDIHAKDSLVYIADGWEGLLILKVTDPANPESIGVYDTPGNANGVFVMDSLAYVADGYEGLQIISISNPSNPELLMNYATLDYAYDVVVQDSLAYIVNGHGDLEVISIYDVSNPHVLTTYNTPGHAKKVLVQDSLIYVADWSSLIILKTHFGGATGSISGTVSDSLNSLLGVTVDLFDSAFSLIDVNSTDVSGFYSFNNLIPGDYSICVNVPLGYASDEEIVSVHVTAGADSVVDFYLHRQTMAQEQQSVSYWRHQVNVHLSGKGSAKESLEDMSNYMDRIRTHFNSNLANTIRIFEVAQPATQTDSLEVLKGLLSVKGNAAMLDKAKQQLITLMLNLVSLKIHQAIIISEDGATVSQAITYCNQLITDTEPTNDETAKDIAQKINKGKLVPSGIIPPDTPDIMYKGTEDETTDLTGLPQEFSLSQNCPNPFNPATEIKYVLPNDCYIKLSVYNVLGQRIKVLIEEYQCAGHKSVHWDGNNDQGQKVSSGVYFYRIEAGKFTESKKMLLLK